MTSDSDFTPLVMRILEAGLPVFGFGERNLRLGETAPILHQLSDKSRNAVVLF